MSQTPDVASVLMGLGEVFAVFDERSQDSGNVSYGIWAGAERYFVKTAGDPANTRPYLSFDQRVEQLQNAACLWEECRSPAIPRLRDVIDSSGGPLLVYEWVDGELLGVPSAMREDPRSAFQRFRALPADEILDALDVIFALHARLAQAGWVASDFYDGCLIYDFERRRLRIVDLDMYHRGPFRNTMGRMFGSTRFMAPEEFEQGAWIDERTTVLTMGRTAAVFLADGTLEQTAFRGTARQYEAMCRACSARPQDRFADAWAFYEAWRSGAERRTGRRPV